MQGLRRVTPLIIALMLVQLSRCAIAQEGDEPAATFRAAVLFRGQLICLRVDGQLAAWSTESGAPAAQPPLAPLPEPASSLADDGTDVWWASGHSLWSWSDGAHSWAKSADFDAAGEDV